MPQILGPALQSRVITRFSANLAILIVVCMKKYLVIRIEPKKILKCIYVYIYTGNFT